jgi:hypothetical protein
LDATAVANSDEMKADGWAARWGETEVAKLVGGWAAKKAD